MERERYQRLRKLVHEAADVPADRRRAFVESACVGDPGLAAEVLAVLTAPGVDTQALSPLALEDAEARLETGLRLDRYVLEREVGRGGMGVVWAARDVETDQRVALKVFHPYLATSPDIVERFRREAALGKRVDHENVVRTLGVGTAAQGGVTLSFLVLEYVEGRTLRALLHDLGTVPEAFLREIARQVAAGLDAIHRAGVVHRDVKPDNVLITDDRRVRITDLGVAKIYDVTRQLTVDGQFVGSLNYASPEQCEGKAIGATSDLYALGVLLYELATGSNPFAAPSMPGVIRAHLELVPSAAFRVNPDISPFFSEVLAALLAKRPEQRLPSSRRLVEVLREGEEGAWWAERQKEIGVLRLPRIPVGRETPVHGRRPILEKLGDLWTDVKRGRGRVVLVEGDAGLGKSRLVDTWLGGLGGEDVQVLYSSYDPARGRGGLSDAIAERFGGEGLASKLAAYLPGSEALLPSFAAMISHENTPDRGAPLNRGALAAVLGRLAKGLAAERPLVWVVEDVHFADAPSRALVHALARVVGGGRILLLLTARPPVASEELGNLERLPHFVHVALEPLDTRAVSAVLEDALQSPGLARKLGPMVAASSGGVPLFALEIIKDLKARGFLAPAADGSWIEARRIEGVHAPPQLKQAFRDRLGELARDERAVLDVAALLGTEFEPDLVARVRESKRIEVLETLGHLERHHGLVRSEATHYRFDHHLVQEVLAEDMPPQLKTEYHALIAEAIATQEGVTAESGKEAPGEIAWRILHHATHGNRIQPWLSVLTPAFRYLSSTFAHEVAIDLADRILAQPVLAKAKGRSTVLNELARHLSGLGDRRRAEIVLAEAAKLAREEGREDHELPVRITQGFHWLSLAQYEKAMKASELAEEIATRLGNVVGQIDALRLRGQVHWCVGDYEEGRVCQRRSLEIALTLDNPVYEARALSDLGVIDQETGFLEEAEAALTRSLELLEAAGARQTTIAVMTNLGNVLHARGRDREALAMYERTLALCEQFADREGEAVAWVNIGEVRMNHGNLQRARRAYEQSLAICREIDAARVAGYAQVGLGTLAAFEGDAEEARRQFERSLDVRRAVGHRPGEASSLVSLAWLAGEQGDLEEARRRLDEVQGLVDELDEVNFRALVLAMRAALFGEDAVRVRDLLAAQGSRMYAELLLRVQHLLWKATGEVEDLDRARALLADLRAHGPQDAAPGGSPFHRAIDEASAA